MVWEDNTITFPYETSDLEAMIENQKNSKIKIKNLTQEYRDSLEYLMIDMLPNINTTNLKRVIKIMEKEG